jgi:hypothetical protein
MKRLIPFLVAAFLLSVFVFAPSKSLHAQDPVVEAVKLAAKKVIKAIDLQIQRLQNVAIELQNIQKEVENTLSKLKLKEIADWTQKQKDLYQQYFDELWRVKAILAYYHRMTLIIDLQKEMFTEYKNGYSLVQSNINFTVAEKEFMVGVYGGMLQASLTGVDDVINMMKSFTVQMSDAERLALIDKTTNYLEGLVSDLRSFNSQNIALSQQRTRNRNDLETLGRIIGQ